MAIAALLPLMLGAATSLPGVPSTPPSEAIVVTPATVEVSPRRRWADVSLRPCIYHIKGRHAIRLFFQILTD
jgi:hypothetical protein